MDKLTNKKLDNRRIIFLDYLRIFAFLSVLIGHKFFSHAVAYINDESSHIILRLFLKLLLPFINGGGAGVVVFFLVSGYIITRVLQTERSTDFFIKRFFRIYPLYITAVLLQTATNLYNGDHALDLYIIIPQLLLIGDLFNTPYTLNGIEWTLRLEIMFYIFMGTLRYFNLLHEHKNVLPWILIVTTVLLVIIAPIPSHDIWSKGYFTIYGPFLFLGAFFYLKEIKQIDLRMLIGFSALVFIQYYYLISVYQYKWIGKPFAILALIIFVLSWRYRLSLITTSSVLFLSDLTYSVYLFHNWAWDPIKELLDNASISILHPDIQALFIVFLICLIMLKIIEKPGIKLGRIVVKYVQKR